MQEYFVAPKGGQKDGCYDLAMHPGGRPTETPRTELGQRLAEAREQAGISQSELAAKLAVRQQAIAYWERHATWFRSDLLVRLTEILGISADELLGIQSRPRETARPVGRARQLFEQLSRLPRRQQEKVIEIVEPFIAQHSKESESAH